MAGAVRAWGCAQLLSIQSVVFSVCRHASRVSRSTAARRRGLVTLAAAESDAAPVAEQAAAPAAKRSLASIQPNEVVEGRVVSVGAVPAALDSDHGQLLLPKPTVRFSPCRPPSRPLVPLLILVLRLRASSTSLSWR